MALPRRVNLESMSTTQTGVSEDLTEYIRGVTVRESDLFRRLREETAKRPNAMMQISAEQGQFMDLLVRMIGAKRTLEVGVFTGYSSTTVALALPPDGRIIACDVSDEYTSVARRYWREAGVEHKIDLRLGPAVETLDALLSQHQADSFDFAFIDADKENYDHYYERALKLLRPGGLIAIDNVLWHGKVLDKSIQDDDTRAIRALNKKLHHDERVFLSLVPVGDGMTLALKRG
jgi:predicted O-methyltransferase YrrM